MSVARVNMKHLNIHVVGVDNLHVFLTQLVDQEQPRTNNNRRERALRGAQTAHKVHNGNQGLATASGHIDAAMGGSQHRINGTLLVGTKFHVNVV